MTNLDSTLKIRVITLLTKVCIVKAIVFPVVMYRRETWTINKAECWRIDGFKLWCWRRLLRVLWTAGRWNQSWIFTGREDAEIEAPTLWVPAVKSWLIGKDLNAGKEWGQEEKGATEEEKIGWNHLLSGHEFEQTPEDSEEQGSLTCCRSWGGRVEHDLATEQQQLPNKSLYNLSATWSLHYFYYDGVEKFSALKIRLLSFYGCTVFFETQMSPILHLLQPLYIKTIMQLIIIDLFPIDKILCFGLFLHQKLRFTQIKSLYSTVMAIFLWDS